MKTATGSFTQRWRRSHLNSVSASLLLFFVPTICSAQEETGPTKAVDQKGEAPIDGSINDIVVTGRRLSTAPIRNVVDYYKKYCFEANRLTGHSEPPDNDPDWHELSKADQLRLGATSPGAKAFGFADPKKKLRLFLKIERQPRSDGLHEEQCSLIVLGGPKHFPFVDKMSAVLHGTPTQRHVGVRDGVPKIPGWKQWLWSGMPARHSKGWRVSPTGGGPGANRDTWIVVADKSFYNSYNYIFGDLKIKQNGEVPVSILSFSHISKDPL